MIPGNKPRHRKIPLQGVAKGRAAKPERAADLVYRIINGVGKWVKR